MQPTQTSTGHDNSSPAQLREDVITSIMVVVVVMFKESILLGGAIHGAGVSTASTFYVSFSVLCISLILSLQKVWGRGYNHVAVHMC